MIMKNISIKKLLSFKPYYKWITFNIPDKSIVEGLNETCKMF